MPGPLDGVTVVDFSVMISGPLAAMLLADQGADVIKVESPGLGDLMRYLGTQRNGMTGIFANCNRGKRSIVVDLKHRDGRDLVGRLVAHADVLIQNFRPGAMERLGLGYDEVHATNPSLIYVSISGYGPDGPNSNRRVYDNVIQAASGVAAVQTDPATGHPQMMRNLVCDKVTAYTAAQAITAALFARERGRAQGQHITLAMLDSAIAFLWPDAAMDAAIVGDGAQRTPTIGSNYAVTQLADGFVAGSAVSDAEFRGWCTALGHPEVADDERFATLPARSANIAALVSLMRGYAAETLVSDFLRLAREHDVPAAAVNSLADLPDDPQVRHNEVFVDRQHPIAGLLREPRPAPRFSDTPAVISRPAPGYSADADEIARSVGLDPVALRAAGVIV